MIPKDHPVIPDPKIGVLLINLGTPDNTDYFSMRRYLKEFLSDKRVIELPKVLWSPILNLFILTFRPTKSGKLYKKIWNKEKNQSPLRINTEELSLKVGEILKKKNVFTDWAMRYGNPSISDKINLLIQKGCTKILTLPLYPQYSATTTASVMDEVYKTVKNLRWQPTMRSVEPYFDKKVYIRSIVKSIEQHVKNLTWKPQLILCSYHGLPKKYFMKGDPYHCHCAKTTRLIKESLKEKLEIEFCFQSRFGPQEWLKPYMNEKFEELLKKKKKRICMIAPGFASDCLETLEEIAIQGKEDFLSMGGTHYSYIPCLNFSKESINMAKELIYSNLEGWI